MAVAVRWGCQSIYQGYPPDEADAVGACWILEDRDYQYLAWEFVIADFDADADTDFADFCILAEHWLAADGSFWCGQGCDLTNDGSVDFDDLKEFAQRWVTGMAP